MPVLSISTGDPFAVETTRWLIWGFGLERPGRYYGRIYSIGFMHFLVGKKVIDHRKISNDRHGEPPEKVDKG